MARPLLVAGALLVATLAAARPAPAAHPADDPSADRWKAWKADLAYLLDEIEKPATLRQIFEVKGIDGKRLRRDAEKRFAEAAKAAKKRKKDDELADQADFYDVLRGLIGTGRRRSARRSPLRPRRREPGRVHPGRCRRRLRSGAS